MRQESLPAIILTIALVAIALAFVNLFFYFSQLTKIPDINFVVDTGRAFEAVEVKGFIERHEIFCALARHELARAQETNQRPDIVELIRGYVTLCNQLGV